MHDDIIIIEVEADEDETNLPARSQAQCSGGDPVLQCTWDAWDPHQSVVDGEYDEEKKHATPSSVCHLSLSS